MKEPSNAVLAAKLDGLKELFETKFTNQEKHNINIDSHLKTLNGQVRRNTKHRISTRSLVKLFGVGAPMVISVVGIVVGYFIK